MVYKSIEEIMTNIEDTIEIVDIIKPLYNFKTNLKNEKINFFSFLI
ncbi:MAG: hypothetical protein GX889_10450 [Clostridiales bacterium]|nr:hypothetical protein [Clostridiales bacterium]